MFGEMAEKLGDGEENRGVMFFGCFVLFDTEYTLRWVSIDGTQESDKLTA